MAKIRNIIANLYSKMFDGDCNEKQLRKRIYMYYRIKTGKKASSDLPQTYTEKIQEYKIRLKNSDFERYTDKIAVRAHIAQTVGEKYLVPLFGVWKSADEIPFSDLPKSYVLKTNHGAGMNYIVEDNSQIDVRTITKKISSWLHLNYSNKNGYEFQYRNIQSRVYAEKKINDVNGNLQEYKFLCFSGKPVYCMVDLDRFGFHKRNIYDMEWTLQKWNIGSFSNEENEIGKPINFDEMVYVAQQLSSGFSHVRVDLYNVDGNIFFSELTFTTGSGFTFPHPENANRMLGNLWNLEDK